MRILYAVVVTGLLVAGCVEAGKKTVCRKDLTYPSQNQMRQLNESLRLVLNHICSLACAGFEHRNMTPNELYFYMKKHLDDYKRISDEMENFCKTNKIEPCCIFVEKNPIELVNILEGFKISHEPKPVILSIL